MLELLVRRLWIAAARSCEQRRHCLMQLQGDVEEALLRLGGAAPTAALVEATSRHAVVIALRERRIVRARRGFYALPTLDPALAAARALTASVSHLSAALAYGWAVKRVPDRPQLTVAPNRNLDVARWPYLEVFRGTPDAKGLLTTPVQTVVDCGRRLPFDEALAVADSALRSAMVTRGELLEAACASPRTGRNRVRRVIEAADHRAANPFESVVRAVALGVPGLRLVPQVDLPGIGQVDLYDERLCLVVECDSFGFHSSRDALLKDIERYNACAWGRVRLLRFGYEHAMHDQRYIEDTLRAAVAAGRRAVGRRSRAQGA